MSFHRLPSIVGSFEVKSIGGNYYEFTPASVTMTGSAVLTYLELPIRHRLLRFELKHTDSSDVDSVDALDYSLARRITSNLFLVMASGRAITDSDIIETFGDDYPAGSTYYRTSLDTTNTDLIYPLFIIERLP